MDDVVHRISRRFEEYTTLVSSFLINSILYRRKAMASADIRRVVIIRLDHIGDVILSMPAVANLRAHFPQAHIAMVVNSTAVPIASCFPQVDEVLHYDARYFDRTDRGRSFNFAGGMSFAREMRKRDYDLIVDLRGSFASLLFALIAKSRHRVDRGTYLVQRKLGAASVASEHEAGVNLDILALAGVPARTQELSLKIPRAELDSADSMLEALRESAPHSPIVVIHSGSPTPLKRWSAARYAQLARRLHREYDARIVLVGGREDNQAQPIVSAMTGQVTDLSGKTTLEQLASILQKADLFIGNDSGPMHLAAACGAKVVGLFGPTSPRRFGPYGDHCTALRMESDCSPCMRDECKTPGYRCIDRISVDDVMAAVRQMMQPGAVHGSR